MGFHFVLLSALEFSRKGLAENFPFAKIYVKMMSCAVTWLLWNLQWPWAESSGRKGKAWPGTVICSLPAASRVEATQGMMERVGKRKWVTPRSDGKAARPARSKGVMLCCPHGMCPFWCSQEDHAAGWPLNHGIACEGEELRLLISMARNVLVLWLLRSWSQVAASSCGS